MHLTTQGMQEIPTRYQEHLNADIPGRHRNPICFGDLDVEELGQAFAHLLNQLSFESETRQEHL